MKNLNKLIESLARIDVLEKINNRLGSINETIEHLERKSHMGVKRDEIKNNCDSIINDIKYITKLKSFKIVIPYTNEEKEIKDIANIFEDLELISLMSFGVILSLQQESEELIKEGLVILFTACREILLKVIIEIHDQVDKNLKIIEILS